MILHRSAFPGDVFAEMDRLQREFQQAFNMGPSIRGFARGGFPALNVGSTAQSVELYAFVPGLTPDEIDVQLEQGVLTIAGARADQLASPEAQATVQINERFAGRFRRVVSLPDDIDPDSVSAQYRDGVLHITIQRRAAAQPRRISVH